MIEIGEAIKALGGENFVVFGDVTNEAEYKTNVKFYSGIIVNNSNTFKDTQDFTWEEASAKLAELQAEYDAQEYSRNREQAYPSLKEFAEAYCEKEINNDNTKWNEYVAKYNNVRTTYPKT